MPESIPSYWEDAIAGVKEMKDEVFYVLYSDKNYLNKGIIIAFLVLVITVVGVVLFIVYECTMHCLNKKQYQFLKNETEPDQKQALEKKNT